MIVPTANNAIPPQNAEPHGAEKNIFPNEQGDDARRVTNADPLDGFQAVTIVDLTNAAAGGVGSHSRLLFCSLTRTRYSF